MTKEMRTACLKIGQEMWEWLYQQYEQRKATNACSVFWLKRTYCEKNVTDAVVFSELSHHNYCALCAVYDGECKRCPLKTCRKGGTYDTICHIHAEYHLTGRFDACILHLIKKVINAHKKAMK